MSRGRSGTVVALLAGVALVGALAGCQPNPALQDVALPPDASGTSRLVAINDAGVAVGFYKSSSAVSRKALLYDSTTGRSTDISQIPVSTAFPSGGTLERASGITAAGVVVGATPDSQVVLYDTTSDTWTNVGCTSAARGDLGMSLYANGNVVCADGLRDVATGNLVTVAQPAGCSGVIAEVNDQNLVVGYCDAGPQPLFVTDLDTGTTAGFGSAQGLGDPSNELGFLGGFADNGMLVARSLDDTTSYLFDLTDAHPVVVPIFGNDSVNGRVIGVSDNGLAGVVTTAGSPVILDYLAGTARAMTVPGAASDGALFGVNAGGLVVGAAGGKAIFGASGLGSAAP